MKGIKFNHCLRIETGQQGFSLVELLVALTIMGILASIALPAYSAYTINARETIAMSRLTQFALTLEQYYGEHFSYEAEIDELRLPDSDDWFDYSISNSDRYSYRIDASPKVNSTQPVAFRLDHLGRRYHRERTNDRWTDGWR